MVKLPQLQLVITSSDDNTAAMEAHALTKSLDASLEFYNRVFSLDGKNVIVKRTGIVKRVLVVPEALYGAYGYVYTKEDVVAPDDHAALQVTREVRKMTKAGVTTFDPAYDVASAGETRVHMNRDWLDTRPKTQPATGTPVVLKQESARVMWCGDSCRMYAEVEAYDTSGLGFTDYPGRNHYTRTSLYAAPQALHHAGGLRWPTLSDPVLTTPAVGVTNNATSMLFGKYFKKVKVGARVVDTPLYVLCAGIRRVTNALTGEVTRYLQVFGLTQRPGAIALYSLNLTTNVATTVASSRGLSLLAFLPDAIVNAVMNSSGTKVATLIAGVVEEWDLTTNFATALPSTVFSPSGTGVSLTIPTLTPTYSVVQSGLSYSDAINYLAGNPNRFGHGLIGGLLLNGPSYMHEVRRWEYPPQNIVNPGSSEKALGLDYVGDKLVLIKQSGSGSETYTASGYMVEQVILSGQPMPAIPAAQSFETQPAVVTYETTATITWTLDGATLLTFNADTPHITADFSNATYTGSSYVAHPQVTYGGGVHLSQRIVGVDLRKGLLLIERITGSTPGFTFDSQTGNVFNPQNLSTYVCPPTQVQHSVSLYDNLGGVLWSGSAVNYTWTQYTGIVASTIPQPPLQIESFAVSTDGKRAAFSMPIPLLNQQSGWLANRYPSTRWVIQQGMFDITTNALGQKVATPTSVAADSVGGTSFYSHSHGSGNWWGHLYDLVFA